MYTGHMTRITEKIPINKYRIKGYGHDFLSFECIYNKLIIITIFLLYKNLL